MKRLIFSLAMILGLTGCTQAPPAPDTREADIQAIRELEAAAMKGWADKNADQIATFYAESAQLIVPGMAPIAGTAAIKAALLQFLGDPNLALTFEAVKVEVAKSGDYGYSQGSYSMTSTNAQTKKPSVEKGTYVTVFQKQADGAWKIVADINTAGPQDAAPAAK